MKPFDKTTIQEIVDQLECGLKCYWNSKTNALLFIPDENNSFIEMEFWENEINQLENEGDDFIEIEKPTSRDSFQMMESFIESGIPTAALKKELTKALERPKPFRNFNELVENSRFREDWFAFKKDWMIKWVESEVEFLMDNIEEDLEP
ncbi:UPF0158 family protein [Flavobacterium sp. NG2]|uniref:UPF0158 family protein n=1 Tax=Flavobacterium sp. NG2 TaxID=3097547 RepID=UPI002A7FF906|nr:UPF0158 family protein [Flavobacterium sp. NG2]WPR71427.1 UPF0158 family protein [Flavobacterium sp. NG2]